MLIEIKSLDNGSVLFSHDVENNTVNLTVEAGVKASANLSYANLSHADLSSADLSSANLSSANLRSANLSSANLRYANLRSANLSSADLSSANLSSANLRSANLSSANLRYANLEQTTYGAGVIIGENPLFVAGLCYEVFIFKAHIKIGCKLHSFGEWENFSDEEIDEMDGNATEFWSKWKTHIIGLARNK